MSGADKSDRRRQRLIERWFTPRIIIFTFERPRNSFLNKGQYIGARALVDKVTTTGHQNIIAKELQ